MALTQPILNSIAAFDATQEHIFSFISIGGDQVLGSQLTIYDNETGAQVYQGNYTSFKFEHPLAAGTLTNGKYYNATISTINNASEFSEPSNPVAFYCYTAPVLTITNIPASGTIEQSNYTFQGNYVQAEGELLNGYQYTLYDSNKEQISQSAILYDGLYQHTFSGMANDTSYYVELSGSTINNTPVSSGLLLFTIRYIQPASFAICDLVNNCQNGFIQISSNIVSIDGKSEPDPPKYIDNKEVDLTDNGSWVQWDEGFNIQNDFTMRIWGRSFGDNEPIVTMKNELDTDKVPNRIEMKFMATDIIDTLPNYIFAEGDIVTTENAVNEPITDLNIGGNSYQKVVQASSESVKFESDNGSINNANPKLGAKLDIEGNSYQETTQGYNLLNVPTEYHISSTDINKIVPISLKANTIYTIQAEKIISDNSDVKNYLFRFRYNNADVSNPYARIPISTLKTTYTPPSDIDTVWIYSGTDYNESTTTNTTYTNLMIYEGTAEKSYELYTGGTPSPNPDYPQKIQNVGDNINLLNKDTVDASNNLRGNVLDTGRRLIANKDGTYTYGVFKLGGRELLGKTLGIHADIETTGGNPRISIFAGNSSSLTKSLLKVVLSDSGTGYMTIPSNLNSELDTISAVLYVTTDASVVAGTYVDYTNLKVQVGSEEVVYSAYNCGSLGVTVSNKNIFNGFFTTNGIWKDDGTINYAIQSKLYWRTDFIKIPNKNIYFSSKQLNIFSSAILLEFDTDKKYITSNKIYQVNSNLNNVSLNENTRFIAIQWNLQNAAEIEGLFTDFQIEVGSIASPYIPHEEQKIVFPLTEGQRLYTGSYLAKDGIHNVRKQVVLDGSDDEDWNYNGGSMSYNVSAFTANISNLISIENTDTKVRVMCNKTIGLSASEALKLQKYNVIAVITNKRIYLCVQRSSFSTSSSTLKTWLQSNPITVEYELAEEEIIPYTDEQQAAYNQLQNLNLYEGINNFSFESGLYPISTLTYNIIKASPAPDNPSEVHFTGDIGNQIDFPDTSVSYTDGLHVAAKPNNNYILLPNRIYTLNFDYVVTNSTTDIYYGIGYGTKDNYVGALTINGEENIQYATQNKGSNSITFQTPATFEGVDTPYLWIDFAKTTITATVAVDISNVSLYFGEYTEYQPYGRYNIPFKILGQNLFNYQKLQYFIDNNTTHEVISNGYSISPTIVGKQSDISIGYTNNLVAGIKYRLSYQTLGDINAFKFYKVEKGTSEIVGEITLNNGVFTAPDNIYDFMLKFDINSESLTNNVNIWNIQIVKGEELLDYAAYTENGLNMDFEQPLRRIGNVKDYILLDNVNLINPTTLRAKVKENTTYYFSNNTTNSYLLEFYNAEDNLIDSEDMTKGSFTTPANCTYITSEDFTTANVTSEQLQIEEGNTFSQYFPYISQPSVIRNIRRLVLTGNENFEKNTNYTTDNMLVAQLNSNDVLIGTSAIVSNYFKYANPTVINSTRVAGSFLLFGLDITEFAEISSFKQWVTDKYNSGEPVKTYYQLVAPQVYNLSGDYEKVLRNFATQVGINNILVDSQYPGYLRLKYANSYTEQETKANYVLLKCWNENTIPYMIHSNYITVKSPKDKIFIWTRRKNNIFDLKIENLGEE